MRKNLIILFFISIAIQFYSQDSRIPGGDYGVAIGDTVRNGKLVFTSEDGNFLWWIDSRLQIDAAMYFENKNPMSNGTTFRRLTFAIKADLWKNWGAELDFDLAEGTESDKGIDLRDMYIKYSPDKVNLTLKVGHFKEPFGLERLNSSRLLTFLERTSMSNAFALGRRIGLEGRYWTDWGQITLGIFGHEAGTRLDKGTRDEGFSTNGRISVVPINEEGFNLHLGLSGSYKTPDQVSDVPRDAIEIRARTETYVFDPKLLHTGDITDVNYYNRFGGELAFIYGPFLFQSEYMGTSIYRWKNKPTVNLKGAYATVSYILTGESRYYYVDEGEVGALMQPKNGFGTIELAARYSYLDLNHLSAGVRGGKSNQLMFGVNYYPNMSIKIQVNYSLVYLDQYATSKGKFIGGDDHSFAQIRFQASF